MEKHHTRRTMRCHTHIITKHYSVRCSWTDITQQDSVTTCMYGVCVCVCVCVCVKLQPSGLPHLLLHHFLHQGLPSADPHLADKSRHLSTNTGTPPPPAHTLYVYTIKQTKAEGLSGQTHWFTYISMHAKCITHLVSQSFICHYETKRWASYIMKPRGGLTDSTLRGAKEKSLPWWQNWLPSCKRHRLSSFFTQTVDYTSI